MFIQSVAAPRRTGIHSWQEPAGVFVRWQVYHKTQSHKLLVCHHLLNLAAKALGHLQSYCCRAVLVPDVIVREKYYRLQFAIKLAGLQQPLASSAEDARHVLLPKGTNR